MSFDHSHEKPEGWHEERRKGIGGSDANIIMGAGFYSKDPEGALLKLWEEKTGKREPEDLSDNLPVRIGQVTEDLNREWFWRATGHEVTDANVRFWSDAEMPKAHAEVDGMTHTPESGEPCILECKHITVFKGVDEAIQNWMPQAHHNMRVAGVGHAAFSILQDNNKHTMFEVEYDGEYGEALLQAEIDFWSCVIEDRAPVAIVAPPPPTVITEFRTVNMSESNEWGAAADDWLTNKAPAAKFDKSKKAIKGLMAVDVGLAFGAGIQAKRTARGVSITKQKETA